MDVAVIGSGVSGLAAAHALSARGAKVTILDVGEVLDAQRQAAVDRLHQEVERLAADAAADREEVAP